MNLNLGKKIFIIIFTSIILIGVEVKTRVDKRVVYRGDTVKLYIEIINSVSSDIIFPNIYKIGSYAVVDNSTQQSVSIINGQRSDNYTKIYSFTPKKTLIIPSKIVTIEGKKYKTRRIQIKVVEPTQAGKGAPIQLELKVDKKIYYDGEGIKLNLIFKRLPNAKFDDIKLSLPDFKDFWMKKIFEGKQGSENNYITQTYSYLLFPKKTRNITIPSAFINIGINSRGGNSHQNSIFSFFENSLTWKKIYSNSINLNIKPLPDNATLYGNFTINASVDKLKVKSNEPVNLTIKIKGSGNLDDIEKFELSINNAIAYSDELELKTSIRGDQYFGNVIQKIAIVSDSNFTIPKINLTFFNKDSKKIEVISSESINIEVERSLQHSSLNTKIEQKTLSRNINQEKQKVKIIIKDKNIDKVLWFSIGFASSIIIIIIFFILKKMLILLERNENITIIKIKKAKNDKNILLILLTLPKTNDEIKNIIYKLEKNIYTKEEKIKINKKDIIKIIYNIKNE